MEHLAPWVLDIQARSSIVPNLSPQLASSYLLLQQLDKVTNTYASIASSIEQAKDKTHFIHETSNQLLQEHQSLTVANEKISETLAYFDDVHVLKKKLANVTPATNLPGALVRLDEIITFLNEKQSIYKDASSYLELAVTLHSQCLVAIKNVIVKSIETAKVAVTPGNDLSPGDTIYTLFYGQFSSECKKVKNLTILLEERSANDLLFECQEVYLNARESLLSPVLSVAIEEMSSTGQPCAFVKNCCHMFSNVTRDEERLYLQYFTATGVKFNCFLQVISSKLYNALRPIVIRLNHFELLSQVCLILKEQMVNLLPLGMALERLLGDAKERLVYRAAVYTEENIRQYNPSPGDLAYPEKLFMMKAIAESQASGRPVSSLSDASFAFDSVSSASAVTSYSPADVHGMWYPSVRRAILCLSRLYNCLDRQTFQQASREVVTACLASLQHAAAAIEARTNCKLDSLLFLIKHLLIVREQIAPFHIECVVREVNLDNFSSSTSLVKLLFEDPVLDTVFDAKKILDSKIRFICGQFVDAALVIVNTHPEGEKNIREKMSLYLANVDTEVILWKLFTNARDTRQMAQAKEVQRQQEVSHALTEKQSEQVQQHQQVQQQPQEEESVNEESGGGV